jgi:putative SOS response-associated peptidase YedK
MCYNVAYLTKRKQKYAEHHGETDADVERLGKQLEAITEKHYNASGFIYPNLLVVTNKRPDDFQMLTWGMVPFFMRDVAHPKELKWNTLNCVGEKMFETKSYKNPAEKRRCLICLDGFYEPHHYKGVSYPFFIRHKNDDPMWVAGLWNDNGHIQTVSLVTVEASPLLGRIHNDKKRMPLILPHEMRRDWLSELESPADKDALRELIQPYDDELLTTYSVPPIRSNKKLGREAAGDTPEALEEYHYDALPEEYYREVIGA